MRNVKIVFRDVRDGFSLYFFDEAGNLLLPSRMKDIPRAELIKQFSKEYTKLKEENERIFAKNPGLVRQVPISKRSLRQTRQRPGKSIPKYSTTTTGFLTWRSLSLCTAGIVASPITSGQLRYVHF